MASGYMFSHYWPGDGASPPVEESTDSYPQRQSAVATLYGGLWFVPALSPLFRQRMKAAWRALRLIFSADFAKATQIVYDVAHTPMMGAADKRAWGEIGQYMGRQPGAGENIYRHLLAAQKWGPEPNGGRERRDSVLQLAYLGYKKARS